MNRLLNTIAALGLLLLFRVSAGAEPANPVSWSVSAEPAGNSEYLIKAVGSIEPHDWHIYDLTVYDGGPNGTSVTVEGADVIEAPRIVSDVIREYDNVFGMETGTCAGPVMIEMKVRAEVPATARVNIEWQACKKGSCMPPSEFSASVELDGSSSSSSIWMLILQAMAWGFVCLLTPCVFPMIPLIVGFFLKRDGRGGRRGGRWLAVFFGLSIMALYTVPVLILIAASLLTGGQQVTSDIFNFLATHWIPNILFFVVFMVFAASFFGAFDLELPSGLTNRFNSKSEAGGILGAFFVALTLVMVSFSCTGPIVGSVLIKSSQGRFWEPVLTMLAFSFAFSLPFTLFAFAPSLLKKLPKSGGWLNGVKVVLGFIEVALGFKFLSVADQAYHWELLSRETYLAIWIVVFSMMGFYLFGKIRFRNDSPVEHIGVPRLALSIVVFSFVVYMIPGMWGAPLKALSGYLPPITTQDFVLGAEKSAEKALSVSSFSGYGDYNEALEEAKKSGRPVFIDFTGDGCVNCREMEARVLSDPRVAGILKNQYVVCVLSADDKRILPEDRWIAADDGRVLKTTGKVNSYMMLKKFGINAQPYYAVIDPFTEKDKVSPRGYGTDVGAFVTFLQAGLKHSSAF